ncbi:hypothetical protein P3X46_002710 [Hevea brasiliensis]|uniref:Letm1 RBD domain-containing protein n=1 Tax=Hevea brasiliensis TaxID=3981 RepID=A0ABQ9N7M3_HEVBR|nr:hypothetical protein P3X46_002710 [Hevea brasiliensis]
MGKAGLIGFSCAGQFEHRFCSTIILVLDLCRQSLKEASPEECDQAVEGLSTAKAKLKAERFKLLWADVSINSRLLLKLAGGRSLSRRERQQLTRTTLEIFILVPFAVFFIVQFMEFLLPIFLKLFPNMLPSTFQDKMKEQEVQNSRSGKIKKTVRRGAGVSNEEILGFVKLFNNELILDNISKPQLFSMCKYMGINHFGTNAYLRYMLFKRCRKFKNDDELIQEEGLESLSEVELHEECRDLSFNLYMQLHDWLDLSLNHSVPSSLMVLSITLSFLPNELVDTVGVTTFLSEDSISKRRIEEEKEDEELARMKESKVNDEDVALKEMTKPTTLEAQELTRVRTMKKQEQLCELSRAFAILASASSVSKEHEEFLSLVNKEMKQIYVTRLESIGTKTERRRIKKMRAMDYDGRVTPEEVANAALCLKDTLGKEGVQELISCLSKDGHRKILVEDIVKLGSWMEDVNTAE